MLVMCSGSVVDVFLMVEVLVTFTLTFWLPKASVAGVSETVGACPVPERLNTELPVLTLLNTVTDAGNDFAAVGTNVTTILHKPKGAKVAGAIGHVLATK